jgi:hypothetical protein
MLFRDEEGRKKKKEEEERKKDCGRFRFCGRIWNMCKKHASSDVLRTEWKAQEQKP